MSCDEKKTACGWMSQDGQTFQSAPQVTGILKPNIYSMYTDSYGKRNFTPLPFPSDSPISLPGLPSEFILKQIRKFWNQESLYKKYKFIHKRGILMYGPPGCGKTSIIRILCDEIIKAGGIVFSITNFLEANRCIPHFRSCEPDRPIMTLMEDVEGLFKGEGGPSQIQAALSFLDGQDQVNNIVHVATTNEPEGLADRFIKRPGRFDLVIGVHAPSAETREAYLRHVCDDQIPESILQELVVKTEGLGLSYLRELASTHLCLDMPLDETLARLRSNFSSKKLSAKTSSKLGFTIGFEEADKNLDVNWGLGKDIESKPEIAKPATVGFSYKLRPDLDLSGVELHPLPEKFEA